jgi:hypothetical protein
MNKLVIAVAFLSVVALVLSVAKVANGASIPVPEVRVDVSR